MELVDLGGRKVRLRDWKREDRTSRRSLPDPSRPWHDTSGPHFGKMTTGALRLDFATYSGNPGG